MAKPVTIREMAERYHVSLRLLRFYEERKMLLPQRRGHVRHYSLDDQRRLEMIIKGKALGFTLQELAALIAKAPISEADNDLCHRAGRARVAEQISFLERRREQVRRALSELYASMEDRSPQARSD